MSGGRDIEATKVKDRSGLSDVGPVDSTIVAVTPHNVAAPPNITPQFGSPGGSAGSVNRTLTEGETVGEYRIVKPLGRGAFGAVYQARHAIIDKPVALKVLNADFSGDAAMAARFVDEARAVNRIAHPNIVDIFGFGMLEDGRKYCVMELLSGSTLAQRLERAMPSASEALLILGQVASALDAAHGAGIVHRDLKPDNIFVCEVAPSSGAAADTLKVKLLDFGIARLPDALHQGTGSNMVLGTPAYMSPEQCAGGHVDFSADIYALGVVVFELLTGSLPFTGTNAMQLTSQHLVAPAPPPSSRRPELAPEVDAAVLRMLAKSPQQRPASATEAVRGLARALQLSSSTGERPDARRAAQSAETGLQSAQAVESGAQSGAGSGAVAASVQPPSLEPRRASPKLMATIALGCAAAVAGTALVWPRHQRAETAPIKPAPVAVAPARVADAPAAPAPPPPRRATPEPQVERVRVVVSGDPVSAKIFRGAEQVGRIGVPFELPRSEEGVRLFVRAPNYAERELRVVPSEDRNLHVTLKRISARRSADLEY
ncbi:MAG TPA: protein kinase [Polyangiaceae bacterium]|nr:protein kinase [Polyangiaceae bacterium]